MKVLLLHTQYTQKGGEDTVFSQERALLEKHVTIDELVFQNLNGWRGAIQFIVSIWNLKAAARLRKKIKEFKPDIVHIHNWHFSSGPIVFRTAYEMGVPIIHTIHNFRLICPSATLYHNGQTFTNSVKCNFPWESVKRRTYRHSYIQTFWLAFTVWFHRQIGTWNKISSFLFLTKFAEGMFKQNPMFSVVNGRFYIKPNFLPNPSIKTRKRQNHFLFVGRLSPEKGILSIIEASKSGDFLVRVAGDGPLKELVIEQAKTNSSLTYLGSLAPEQITSEMLECSALIVPSECFEGMPMTILEAMSLSTPVIAPDFGAMGAMLTNEKNSLLYPHKTPNSLTKCLKIWSEKSEEEKVRLGFQSHSTFLELYSEERNKSLLLDIYRDNLVNG
jgi:glycosyltransferase involved in cell wall biosynthesis